ncbi:chemotaxis protein CheA [bacterium]|nr:chemotaxis protein CheA [bacterium]
MDSFEKELKISFLQEAAQILSDAEQCYLSLEKKMDDHVIDEIFRLSHNIKGSAAAVGFLQLSEYMHEVESFLLKIKNRQIKIKSTTVTLLLNSNDHLKKWINLLFRNFEAQVDSVDMIHSMQKHGTEKYEEFNADHLLSMMNFTTELTSPVEPESVPQIIDETIRVALPRLEKLMNYVGELVILQTVLNQHKDEIKSVLLQKTVSQLNKITKDIQDISMGLRMLPLKQTFQKMQRIVRDTSAELGKDIQFVMEGEDTEIDKTVIEKLSDPLIHIIRNAVDHGIESPSEREAIGKSRAGRIYLRAFHSAGKIVIQIKDDGRGLNPQFLTKKAIEKGLISTDAALSVQEAQNLIFLPGFSTKAESTDISGRGVGMDVVKTNIEKVLRGEVSIESEVGKGTQLSIQLPLTLAIIDGMVVSVGAQRYIVPLFQIHESLRLNKEIIHQSTGLGYLLNIRGQEIPVYRLGDLLSSQALSFKPLEKCIAIVVHLSGQSVAIAVDDIMTQHQVVIKSLGHEMRAIKGFAGGAILGDGKAAIILDLPDLIAHKNQKKNSQFVRGVA